MIKKILGKPKIIGVIANVNEGKTNLLTYIIENIKKRANVCVFGLRFNIKETTPFFSLEELENIKDSVIVIDEMSMLFDFEDRYKKALIENTLRLINHHNNILIVCGLPENFKKFISAKLNAVLFKRVDFADFINGSKAKRVCLEYSGMEKGSYTLSLEKEDVLFYDGKYKKYQIPYLKGFDTKLKNKPIAKDLE